MSRLILLGTLFLFFCHLLISGAASDQQSTARARRIAGNLDSCDMIVTRTVMSSMGFCTYAPISLIIRNQYLPILFSGTRYEVIWVSLAFLSAGFGGFIDSLFILGARISRYLKNDDKIVMSHILSATSGIILVIVPYLSGTDAKNALIMCLFSSWIFGVLSPIIPQLAKASTSYFPISTFEFVLQGNSLSEIAIALSYVLSCYYSSLQFGTTFNPANPQVSAESLNNAKRNFEFITACYFGLTILCLVIAICFVNSRLYEDLSLPPQNHILQYIDAPFLGDHAVGRDNTSPASNPLLYLPMLENHDARLCYLCALVHGTFGYFCFSFFYPNIISSNTNKIWSAVFIPMVFLIDSLFRSIGRLVPAFSLFGLAMRMRLYKISLRAPLVYTLVFVSCNFKTGSGYTSFSIMPRLIEYDWIYFLAIASAAILYGSLIEALPLELGRIFGGNAVAVERSVKLLYVLHRVGWLAGSLSSLILLSVIS